MKVTLLLILSFHLCLISTHCTQQQQDDVRTKNSSDILLKTATTTVKNPGEEDTAVDNLLKNQIPVTHVQITPRCRAKTTAVALENNVGDITQYLAVESCQVSNHADDTKFVVAHDNTETEDIVPRGLLNDLRFRTMFLQQLPNKVTYMILNPDKAHWFFTDMLSGCDIFIATKTGQTNMPLVVHANANILQNAKNQGKNLQWKGMVVDHLFNNEKPDYRLVVRLHVAPEQPIPDGYNKYLTEYDDEHPGVTRSVYDVILPTRQGYYFMGYFTNRWKFFYKGSVNGAITEINV